MSDTAVQPRWVTRAAVAAGAFLILGSVGQIVSGSPNTSRHPAPPAHVQLQAESAQLLFDQNCPAPASHSGQGSAL